MTNYVQLHKDFDKLRELRRSAFEQILEAHEHQEASTTDLELDLDTPDVKRAATLFEILDKAVTDSRKLLIESYNVTDLTTFYEK